MNENESKLDVRKHKLVRHVEVLPLISENSNLVYIAPGCRVKLRQVASVRLAYLAALIC